MAFDANRSFDEEDWSRPVFGPTSWRSILERRSLIENNGVVPVWADIGQFTAKGKFFPRGMRGFLQMVFVYCRDRGIVGGTIEVHISPFPESGTSYQVNIVVPGGGVAAWRPALFNLFWNYDSLFVWIIEVAPVWLDYAYDLGEPHDAYWGAPTGIVWQTDPRRNWIRITMAGETPGDVPVSGTVNVVLLPNLTAAMDHVQVEVDGGDTETILPHIWTMGKLTCLMLKFTETAGAVPPANVVITITTDGVAHTFTVAELIAVVDTVANTVSPISMGSIVPATNEYQVNFSVEFPFRMELHVEVQNTAVAGNTIDVDAIYVYEIIG